MNTLSGVGLRGSSFQKDDEIRRRFTLRSYAEQKSCENTAFSWKTSGGGVKPKKASETAAAAS